MGKFGENGNTGNATSGGSRVVVVVGSVVVALRVRPNSKLPERSVWNAAALMVLDASQTCTITKPCKDVSMRFSF